MIHQMERRLVHFSIVNVIIVERHKSLRGAASERRNGSDPMTVEQ